MEGNVPPEDHTNQPPQDNGLSTIEEVFEPSRMSNTDTPSSEPPSLEKVSTKAQTMTEYLRSLENELKPKCQQSLVERRSIDSIVSAESLRKLSTSKQDIFDTTRVSTTFYSVSSDPVKPSMDSTISNPVEITRAKSLSEVPVTIPEDYSEILGGVRKQRHISYIPTQRSYSSSLTEAPLS